MRKSIHRMFWIFSLVMVFLVSNSVLFAQSPVIETTPAQSDQGSADIQQQDNDIQNQATVYLNLNMFYVGDVLNTEDGGTDNIYLTNNGTTIWGPVEASGGDIIDIETVISVTKSSSVRLELRDENTGKSLGKVSFSFNSLNKIVDKGEYSYNFRTKFSTSSLTWNYKLNYEVRSTDDSSDSIMGLSASADCGGINSPGNPFDCCTNGGNCTWWAWHMAKSTWGVDFPARGNAKDWATTARNNKYYVSTTTPSVNTIAVNTNQAATIDGVKKTYGHVAWVEEVSGDKVKVSEMSCCVTCGYGPKYNKEYSKSYFNGGFIYPQSDLTVSNLSVSPTSGSSGTKVTVSFSINNTGKGPSGASTTNIRINQSSSDVTPTDTKLASVSVPSISSGATSTFTKAVTIPRSLSAGTYYIWVTADVNNKAYQKDVTNDKAYTSFTVN